MKLINVRYFFIAIIVLNSFDSKVSAINMYSELDTLFVWADGGLTIRDSGAVSGNKIGLVPYGDKIVVLGYKLSRGREEEITIQKSRKGENDENFLKLGLQGRWVKMKYKSLEGFVFDGYLSHLPAPIIRKEGQGESLDTYIERQFGVISRDEKSGYDYVVRNIIYGGGISFLNIGEKGAYVRYILPQFSLEEILLFLINTKTLMLDGSLNLIEDVQINAQHIRILTFKSNINGEGSTKISVLSGIIILEIDASC